MSGEWRYPHKAAILGKAPVVERATWQGFRSSRPVSVPRRSQPTARRSTSGSVAKLQAGRNPKRMAELGLTEYGIERFALAGNANDWIGRISELAELGASRLWLSTESGDLDRQIHYMKVFTEQVMPHFR